MTDKELIIGEIKREGANSRKMISRLKDEHLAWKPHEKSYSSGTLAQHISNLPVWVLQILNSESLDLAAGMGKLEAVTSTVDLLAFFDSTLANTLQALENFDDAALNDKWLLKNGETTIIHAPRKIVLRYFVMNHIVHHRGQLAVYLRLLDIPVPGMYGPSADER